ncbi:hypothetical protein KXD93_02050 [Mucilaginibacter sp. BJC16-A38]|uniref:hypothetical protein n=1 Tax=Mucilaginibacter phenanthrenivorans TaxID=1234842 RepID=UPI0021570039|nr:hypothetical protein [Mucilaginibacter phenanthrenivorans]MCR8556403.1 hypothetical protein [Mucilaginibacter phenanthrenivorans]
MKRYVLVFFLFIYFSSYSQNTINNYKYVVVPEKFNFLKENDQYSLNSYTKGFLQDKGFTVYFDNAELPSDIANNKCSALNADVLEKSGMFSTSLTVILKDCRGNVVFKSKEGKSREKDYKTAYYLALKGAFASLDKVSYVNKGSTNEPAQPVVTSAASTAAEKPTTVASTTPEKQITIPATSAEPEKSKIATSVPPAKTTETVTNQPAGTLYAQAIVNGYQLIDTTPKIVLTLLKTSAENYFIANNATANGIVLKKNDAWFFEYYKDGKLVSEKLLVKF